jgi:hypothetical protein
VLLRGSYGSDGQSAEALTSLHSYERAHVWADAHVYTVTLRHSSMTRLHSMSIESVFVSLAGRAEGPCCAPCYSALAPLKWPASTTHAACANGVCCATVYLRPGLNEWAFTAFERARNASQHVQLSTCATGQQPVQSKHKTLRITFLQT